MPLPKTTFDNLFDLFERDLSEITIKETKDKEKCFVWDLTDERKVYNSFLISKNSRSKTICEVAFYKSSETHKYLPRLTFKRVAENGDIKSTRSQNKVIVEIGSSKDAIRFWKLIGFLLYFKDLVDIGEFEKSYQVVTEDAYVLNFKEKGVLDKIYDLKELISFSDLNYHQLKSLTFENRKKNLKAFLYLLKDIKNSRQKYSKKFKLEQGEEAIWHHFLQNNDWILGLNSDMRFINDFLNEQKLGIENSKGSESPIVDFLGVSEFITLIELKHSSTNIFKLKRSKGRANTWDFTSNFIEGISQCLGQRDELIKNFRNKDFVNEEGQKMSKDYIEVIDPKSLFLIGNKKREFPIKDLDKLNILKNNTFERFRRNNRNIDILTFDELFERAYHIVFSKKLDRNWYWQSEEEIFIEEK